MPYISSENKTDWTADLVAVRAQIAAIIAETTSGPLIAGIKRITFNAGTGEQTEIYNSPQEMFTALAELRKTRDLLKRKLNGTDILISATRR